MIVQSAAEGSRPESIHHPKAQESAMTPDPQPLDPQASHVPESDDERPSDAFAEALAEFESGSRPAHAAATAATDLAVGSQVKGTVVGVGEEFVLIDFGGRSEAVVETRHFRAEDGTVSVAVGAVLELFVIEAADQVVLAPSIRAEPHAALRQVREARAAGVPVSGRVTAHNAGGLQVDLGGVRAFCPLSQIEAGFCADPSVYVGRTLEFLVTSIEEGRGGAVLSRRALLRQAEAVAAQQVLAALKPGDEREGRVARLEAFGAFVDLGGVDGLVHVSEIRHDRTGHPKEVLHEGETVKVRVLRIETGKDGRPRVALSIKACAPDPWTGVAQRYAPGTRVHGVVARLADFGAFVTLEPGIDGLVHVSQVAHQRITHPKEVLTPGQEVEAVVLAVEPDKKRVSLSIKQLTEAPERAPRAAAPRPRPRTREERAPAPVAAAPSAPAEPTTMAIALRKAMEEAARRQGKTPA